MPPVPATRTVSAAVRKRIRRRARRRALIVGLTTVGGTLVTALMVWLVIRVVNAPTPASADDFFESMQAVAAGASPPATGSGMVFHAERRNGQTIVTAENIPPGPCVSAGWKLVRRGTLTINGTTPTRVSAARLAELCNQSDFASVVWIPRPE